MAAAASAETAPCSSITRAGTPRLASFTSFGVRDDRADEDVARAGNGGQPRSHHSSGARLRGRELQVSRAAEVEDDLRHRPLVLSEEVRGELRPERLGNVRAARLSALIDEEVDVDLELAGTDGHLHSIALTARRGERLCDG